jgi:hypothetical protein
MNCKSVFIYCVPCVANVQSNLTSLQAIPNSWQGKRQRTESSNATTPTEKRVRAINPTQRVPAAPASWVMLQQQIQHTWTYNAARAKLITEGVQSMHSEDLSSHIVTKSECLTDSQPLSCHQSVSYIVRTMPEPTFATIPKDSRPFLSPDAINIVYWQFPAILVSINARNAVARDPSMDLNTDLSLPFWRTRHAPVVLPVHTRDEYLALCRLPKTAQTEDVTQSGGNSYVIASGVRDQIHDDYILFHEHDMVFAAEMGRLLILAPQHPTRTQPDNAHTVPHSLISTMSKSMDETYIHYLLNTNHHLPSKVMDRLNILYESIGRAIGCSDEVMLRALDACAILGGVQLPQWPPNSECRGAAINPKDLPKEGIETSEDHDRLLATIRKLERWGVPIWGLIVGSRHSSRVDVVPYGLPSADKAEEDSYQATLRSLNAPHIQRTQLLVSTGRVHANDVDDVLAHWLPVGRERYRLQRAIIALMDHDSPNHMDFKSFSSLAQEILGRVVWTGRRHEEMMHPSSFDILDKLPWCRVRDVIRDCTHCGVNIALFQIPLPWVISHSSVATMAGEYVGEEFSPSLAATACGSWFVLEVNNFKQDERLVFQKLAERFSDGACGWAFVQSGLQQKDAGGKTIPRSRFIGRLLFKQQHVRERVSGNIALDFKDHEQSTRDIVGAKDDFLFNYTFFNHPHFADIAYGEPITSIFRDQVMRLAPPFDVMPSSSGSKDRAIQVKWSTHNLRHSEMLEISKFPPLVANSYFPRSRHPAPSSSGFDMSSCTLNLLRQLAAAAVPTPELSFMDICRMQRFAYIMEVLAKHGSFSCRVFPSNGPYLKILRYLSLTIRNSSPAGSTFASGLQREKIPPFHEAVRLTPSGRVEIILNVDASDSSTRRPSQDELNLYHATLEKQWDEFSKKLSRSESRRQKVAKQIATGIAAGISRPSRDYRG